MESQETPSKLKEQEQSKLINTNNQKINIKSNFIVKIFFGYIHKRKLLEIIKYNKYIQKRINIDINHYKDSSEQYSSIELEIIPMKNEYGQFIYIKEENKKYYHIYFSEYSL